MSEKDPAQLRRDAIDEATSVIVKVGTRVLTNAEGKLDRHRVECLARGLCKIADTGRQTVIVSSGAVGAGMGKLGMSERPPLLSQLQAVAAVGQADLIQAYESAMAESNRHAAQVLLTRNDLRRRAGYLHVRNALSRIHELGAIAVVNENDSVAVSELRTTFGDNDRLAAEVAGLLDQTLLVILSDIDGLYDGPPSRPESQLIETVELLDEEIMSLAHDSNNKFSKGGMASKLTAAQLAISHGHNVIIGPGRDDHVLEKILNGERIGTLFLGGDREIRGRRRWISGSAKVLGQLVIDDGAAHALREGGCSLLGIGITAVQGDFKAGAVVSILDSTGLEVARGLSNYRSSDIHKIRGMPSDKISQILGHCPHDSVVHRDNMTVLDWLASPATSPAT